MNEQPIVGTNQRRETDGRNLQWAKPTCAKALIGEVCERRRMDVVAHRSITRWSYLRRTPLTQRAKDGRMREWETLRIRGDVGPQLASPGMEGNSFAFTPRDAPLCSEYPVQSLPQSSQWACKTEAARTAQSNPFSLTHSPD
eukprot:scaffold1018_cov241-Pinguiococcus_pyrenoidosus.AAC.1